jgi:hypothetical protein
LQQASRVPKKHILDNEVSEATKIIIKDEYKMSMELAPPQAATAGMQWRLPFEILRPIS